MEYTKIPSKIKAELNRMLREPYTENSCKQHPTYFAKHILGLDLFLHQHFILRQFADSYKGKNDRTIICKSRQIGMSIGLGLLAIWFAAYNKSPTGIHKNTKVGIISKSDDDAKKLMREIQTLCRNAQYDFPSRIKQGKTVPLNKREIHFEKGWIKCFPPTGAPRGSSFDLLIVDESAFVDDEEFRDSMEPTVSFTGGKIILSSTPFGQSGFFYEIFDPDDLLENHEYTRVWFHEKVCTNPIQRKIIEQKKKFCQETGNMRSFDQEYNALFTADEVSFFDNADLQKSTHQNLSFLYECHDYNCSLGIDYGSVYSQTCLSVVAVVKDKLQLIFQFAKNSFDENLLFDPSWEHSISNLKKRYNIVHIVVDKCAQGDSANKRLKNEGNQVYEFDFRSDRVMGERGRGYYVLRAAMKLNKLMFPNHKEFLSEMKAIQETKNESSIFTRIKAPKGYRDDRSDSFMMACFVFLQDDSNFSSMIVEYDKVFEELRKKQRAQWDNPRHDAQWDSLTYNFKKVYGHIYREDDWIPKEDGTKT